MVEQFDFRKVDQQLAYARERKQYADAARDQARASRDAFLSSAVSAAIPLIGSDIRLKENITRTGTSESGIPIYTFNYKNDSQLWSGTIAQDLLSLGRKDAVGIMSNGYYGVDYNKIDVNMTKKNN